MTPLSTVITRLQTAFPAYEVVEAKGNEQDLLEPTAKPRITVGYGPIRNSHPEVITTFDLYEKNGDGLVQSFYLKYICLPQDFRSVFIAIYKNLSSFNPNAPGDVNTGFCYVNGEPIGLSNGFLWFESEWKINFPTNTLLQ